MTDEPVQAESRAAPKTAAQEAPASETSGTNGDKPLARRRRRRGGRGRGPKPPTSDGGDGPAEDDASSRSESAKKTSTPRTRSTPTSSKAKEGAAGGSKPSRPRAQSRPKASTTAKDAGAEKTEPAAEKPEEDRAGADGEAAGDKPPARRRRRRGGRGRKKPASSAEGVQAETEDAPSGEAAPAKAEKTAKQKSGTGSRTRRKPAAKDASAEKSDASAPLSTRRAARSARTTGRRTSGGRRRESLPPLRRVRNKVMVITEHGERDQIAVLEDRLLVQHYITRVGARSMVGNIYMAKVQNVLPGMEAAFLDIGRGRNAVLYAGEVNYDEEVDVGQQRIEHVLKPNQAVMVQVTKDPLGGKGARLTAQVSLPGRYLVLVPNSQVFGISRRLEDAERRRLRSAVKKVMPDQHGIIVRTAADGASEEDLAADVERLVREWEEIAKRSKKAKAPAVLYEEPELTVRVVRDLFNGEEFEEMVTDSPRIYEIVTGYLASVAPDLLAKVRLHEGALPAFEEFHIVEQIHKALDRKVWLPSGGYLIIDRTEALTVIDVNTGKHVGKTNLEETVVKTNLEAAEEVARQLRLRDIGGMIIIDFIDMLLEPNKKRVIQTIKEALAQDKTRSQVFDISPLGLLEMTRKRVSAGLVESFSETCPTCEGRGILLTLEI